VRSPTSLGDGRIRAATPTLETGATGATGDTSP
jgi:hypothetical protein